MDPSALAGLCALLSRADGPGPQALRLSCAAGPSATSPARPQPSAALARLVDPEAREAIARVSFAEAGNQGDSGLAGVVYTILNRLQDGRWGGSVDAVVNARGQFEPVTRAGGDWRRLPALSAAQLARVDTILNLALDGRLPDLTNGARFFQNPVIVARREGAGQVSPGLVDFGGSPASAIIGAHRFYVSARRGGGFKPGGKRVATGPAVAQSSALIVGDNRMPLSGESDPRAASADPSHALFVGADGRVGESPR